ELPENLTVGGSLYLRGTQISELPENNKFENQDVSILSWKKGKYIKVDDMFCEVINKRGKVWKCKKINKKQHFYIVTDGNGKYSHGETVKEAKDDLLYKISNRNKDDFKHLSFNSVLSFEKMIECYRVITGACGFGVKDFVENNKIEKRDYSIREIITITKDSYGGSSFSNFFSL
ncbi:hypothetical protein, partial [uncultured Winogradskyella sp.]|uniref:hypothetical protein n=1 Tax=uncultured Winogradskyella sp. TaxID=395353 RepID=UPI0026316D11